VGWPVFVNESLLQSFVKCWESDTMPVPDLFVYSTSAEFASVMGVCYV